MKRLAFFLLFMLVALPCNAVSFSASVNKVINVQFPPTPLVAADPTGVNDSTAALQAIVNYACPAGSCDQGIYFPAGSYKISKLNVTNLSGLVLEAESASGWPARISSIICTESSNNSGICIDMSGSSYTRVDNLTIAGASGLAPQVLVLLAKNTTGTTGFVHNWRNDTFIQQGGDWGVYNYGGEQWVCEGCYFNGTPNHADVMISVANTFSISSSFTTTQTAPTSMTRVSLINSSYGMTAAGSGANAPILFDSTNNQVIIDGEISGYCNSPNGVPCIGDSSSSDTGIISDYKITLRHEPQGSNPGPLISAAYSSWYGARVKSSWNPASATTNPALNFAGLTNWDDFDIFTPQGKETSYEIICSGTNVLGTTIHDYYTASANQSNNCLGAIEIAGVYGLNNATEATHFADVGINKLASALSTAPGAGSCKIFTVAGTNSGTCKLQAECGTSTTPTTILDNIGSGC